MRRLVLLFILLSFIAVFSFAQVKHALVIGNGAYTHTTPLNNPVNDANDMEIALRGLGFTVEKVLNGSQDQMVNAVMQLKRRLSASKNSYGFLFYAGHGVQSGGENFLIPVDANIPSENFLRNRTVSVQEMLDELNDAGNEFNVVVLDACRDNPFSWRRSGSRGLSIVGHQPADSIVVYATAAGSTAADGTGRNGLFTSHLLNNLKIPGIEVTEVFRRTGADVASASGNSQRPAVYNQFYGTAYLGTGVAATAYYIPPVLTAQLPVPHPNYNYRVTGHFAEWGNAYDERFIMENVSGLDHRIKAIEAVMKDAQHIYLWEYYPGIIADTGWKNEYPGANISIDGKFAIKIIRLSAIEKSGWMFDMWIPSTEAGGVINLSPDTIFIPRDRSEADRDAARDGLGSNDDNPVLLKGEVPYYIVFAVMKNGSRAIGAIVK